MRSTCPSCGTVDVPAYAVTVLVPAASSTAQCDPLYRYVCPGCHAAVEKPTAPMAVTMLRAAGSTVLEVPAEVVERGGSARPPLDAVDLDDLLRELDGADDLARFATDLRRPTSH